MKTAIEKLFDSHNGIIALAELTGQPSSAERVNYETADYAEKKRVINGYEEMLDLKELMSGRDVASVYRKMVEDARKELQALDVA